MRAEQINKDDLDKMLTKKDLDSFLVNTMNARIAKGLLATTAIIVTGFVAWVVNYFSKIH